MTFDELLRILQVLVGIGIIVIGAWVRTAIGRVTDRIERLEERTAQNETDIAVVRNQDLVSLRDKAVTREDWIRESSRVSKRLDRLIEGQAELRGKTDLATALAQCIKNMGDAHRQENDTSA